MGDFFIDEQVQIMVLVTWSLQHIVHIRWMLHEDLRLCFKCFLYPKSEIQFLSILEMLKEHSIYIPILSLTHSVLRSLT